MKTGTVVIIIVLIFTVSFIGVGFLLSRVDILAEQNQELIRHNILLENELDQERKKNQQAHADLDELHKQLEDAKTLLAREKAAKDQAVVASRVCETRQKRLNLFYNPLLSILILPVAIGSLLGVFGLDHWIRAHKTQRSSSGLMDQDKQQIVTVQVSREELKEYLRFKRRTRPR